MAFIVPFAEPEEFAAGDRVQWKRTLSSYPVSEGWTLTYYFRSAMPGGSHDIVAVTSTSDYSVDILPAVTAQWTPGVYFYQAFVSKDGDRKLVASGSILVRPDFASLTAEHDGRSYAQRNLDAWEAVMAGRSTHDQQRYVIQSTGRSVDRISLKEMREWRDYWIAEVRKETPGGKSKNIMIRFNR